MIVNLTKNKKQFIMIDVGGVASWGGFVPFRPSRQNYRHKGTFMRICKIINCNNKHLAKGFCKKHYSRFRRHGNPFHTEFERHGMINFSEYKIWDSMIQRCTNKNNVGYHNYGGRGITVCAQWLNSFRIFYKDMGPKTFPKAEIDRIDNDLGYAPENCRWATHIQNNQNRSNNKLSMQKAKAIRGLYKINGVTQKQLASVYGIGTPLISRIINQKIWSEDFNI